MNNFHDDLVLRAIRIAEHAHRNRPQGHHLRKAPEGQDRPYYFVHLAEVAWILADAGCSHELIAAGYLHDVVEDCGYTWDQLEEKIGNHHVVELVKWVTEPDRFASNGKKLPWEDRNKNYLERIRKGPVEALTLSCADKTANIMEMFSWLEKGYRVDEFTSRDHATQLAKFEALDEVFQEKVVEVVYGRFCNALAGFRSNTFPKSNNRGARAMQ